ncbi:hypothetical protein PIB30_093552 [Stylosanthes scabra]|uniref:Uncharacterized protein n=1 Tax=Stylosanthes scabra TaxID=79078 RepID=A0ABU6ZTS3_9FABA|nr:hypothetical protein [Stylosanthes scabra]
MGIGISEEKQKRKKQTEKRIMKGLQVATKTDDVDLTGSKKALHCHGVLLGPIAESKLLRFDACGLLKP